MNRSTARVDAQSAVVAAAVAAAAVHPAGIVAAVAAAAAWAAMLEQELAAGARRWCIYLLRDARGVPLYVGKDADWPARWDDHVITAAGDGDTDWRDTIDPATSGPARWCWTDRQALRVERRRILTWRLAADRNLAPPPGNVVHNRRPRNLLELVWLSGWLAAYRVEALLAPRRHPFAPLPAGGGPHLQVEPRRAAAAPELDEAPVDDEPFDFDDEPTPHTVAVDAAGLVDEVERWLHDTTQPQTGCVDCGDTAIARRRRCLPCARAYEAARKAERRRGYP